MGIIERIEKMTPEERAQLARLRKDIVRVQDLIAPLNMQLDALREAKRALLSEFRPGDIITWQCGRRVPPRFLKGRVVSVLNPVGNTGCWMVTLIKQSGAEGKTRKVWGWDNPTKI